MGNTLQPRFQDPSTEELKAKQRRALELRKNAWSVREIADEMKTTVSVVNVWISSAIREYIPAELREDVRAIQLDRYETLLRAYIDALRKCTTLDQLEKCGRLIHSVMQRIDVLCGTESPREVRVDGQVVSISQLDMELAEMIREAKARAELEEQGLIEEAESIDG